MCSFQTSRKTFRCSWCTPQQTYPTNIPKDGKVSDFIEDKGWTDSSIIFCQDDPTADAAAYDTLGGVDSFPYTVVIDAEGIIAHKFDSAKIESYDELLDPVLDAMK